MTQTFMCTQHLQQSPRLELTLTSGLKITRKPVSPSSTTLAVLQVPQSVHAGAEPLCLHMSPCAPLSDTQLSRKDGLPTQESVIQTHHSLAGQQY